MGTEQFEISPLRTLDDFILGSARFQIPNFKDMEKWGNRVVNNLLYYQTNYFVMGIIIFLLVGVLHPVKMLFGTLALSVTFGLFYYFTNVKSSAAQFKKNHPMVGVALILGGGWFVVYLLDSVLVFLFGILLPICMTFIHASMRLRNIKNKLSNKIEMMGLTKTPMGNFLEALEVHGLPIRRQRFDSEPKKSDILYKAKY
ncbi:UNVERIFIED_CONTAM: hypothetical protein PYX00_003608 [Menopon gallinae]|uniref:PRA1 family protein n=1 Tax=Menopon gallinae TaxID=328185 RepID=A0AAW2I111_9NEOP